jgi:hypothetical protein
MKKMKFTTGVLILLFATMAVKTNAQIGRFKTTQYGHTLVGYNTNWWGLSFGNQSSAYGSWNIQYYDQGLNFWKPTGTPFAGDYKLHIHDQGFVGINGKANPGRVRSCGFLGWSTCSNFRLQVFGNAIANGWYTFSDSSIKENVAPIQNVLTQLLKMTPIEYNYKATNLTGAKDTSAPNNLEDKETSNQIISTDAKRRYGFTAQQVKRVFPNLEEEFNENVGVVDYSGFVPLLVAGVQEQYKIIDSQKRKIDSLNMQIQNLRQEIINWQGRTINDLEQSKTKLFQNNPNPFDGATTISYYIDENISVQNAIIEVRDIMGNLQNTIPLGDRSGLGEIQFDGSHLNMGYYVYTLKINGSTKDSKMFLKEQ